MNHPFPFLFVVCQRGAEDALKSEVAREWPDFRFAFSRPGFVTFKLPSNVAFAEDFDLRSVFARTHGFSLGHVSGLQAAELAREAWRLTDELPCEQVHCWQRDAAIPGDRSFEPGPTLLADEAASRLIQARPARHAAAELAPNAVARPGQAILDCVLVEPDQWWIGWHRASSPASRWPGGVPPMDLSRDVVTRAYFKMSEALRWSRLPLVRGDTCAEVGSSPGGAAQCLLERGLRVIGIDPAEMDERVLSHSAFTHVRKRAADVRRREFSSVRWLFADSNVAPNHTLDSIESIVTHASVRVRGMLLTLKLLDWKLAAEVPAYLKRVRSWGYRYVMARQLAFNRREICVCALRSRSTRRLVRQQERFMATTNSRSIEEEGPESR